MMATAIQDGDAIFARAITIASPEERAAYLSQACGDDVALRRQVEERIAAHFQGEQGSKELPTRTSPEQAATAPAPQTSPHGSGRRRDASALARWLPVLTLALAVLSIGLLVWALRERSSAAEARHEAELAREHERKAEEEVTEKLEQAEVARQAIANDRDQAVEQEKAARDSVADMKAVVAFFQGKVLGAGRATGWAGGQGKDVTLRKALDAAESRVAEAFANRPLAEAAIRETLGTSYLDLQEPDLAVKQLVRALALREALQGEDQPDTVLCRNKLAVAYRRADRPLEASRLYDVTRQSASHAAALVIRGVLLLSQKKPAEAEKALRECVNIRQKIQADDWSTFEAKSLLGEALCEQKKYADAEPLLVQGYEGLKERTSKIPSQGGVYLTRALSRLVRLYDDWDKKDKAAQWRKELEEAKRKQP